MIDNWNKRETYLKGPPTALKFSYVANEQPAFFPPSHEVLTYRHQTLAEYCAEIGEKEFAIETDFEKPLSP